MNNCFGWIRWTGHTYWEIKAAQLLDPNNYLPVESWFLFWQYLDVNGKTGYRTAEFISWHFRQAGWHQGNFSCKEKFWNHFALQNSFKTCFLNMQSNLIEIALRHGCSPINLMHIFRTHFTKNTSGWLLLWILWWEKKAMRTMNEVMKSLLNLIDQLIVNNIQSWLGKTKQLFEIFKIILDSCFSFPNFNMGNLFTQNSSVLNLRRLFSMCYIQRVRDKNYEYMCIDR